MPLKIVLLICNIGTAHCTLETAHSHFTMECASQLPSQCLMQAQEELAKMAGLYDTKTQVPFIQLARR